METLAEQGEDSNVIILSLFSLLFANIISFYWPEPLRNPHFYFFVSFLSVPQCYTLLTKVFLNLCNVHYFVKALN